MDEVNHSSKPKRTRVLRAADVIPPFDKSVLPSDDGETDAQPPQPPSCETHERKGGAETSFAPADTTELASAEGVEIPTYDLAENILAEQRRAAGRRRLAPGRAQDEPIAPPRGTGVRMFIPEPASQDLLELQRIVAEIVARDIERLCKRSDRPLFVVCP